jgi:glycosyltransferase involved in cell wall biosynthesis
MQDIDKKEFEVIVIDNGSNDNTKGVLSALDLDLNLIIIRTPQNQSRGKARNLGIQASSGDIMIFSDGDMISDHNFVSQHASAHKIKNRVVCGINWDKIFTYFYKDFKGKLLKSFIEIQTKNNQIHHLAYLKDKECLIDKESIIDDSYKQYVFTQSLKEQGYKRVLEIYGNEFREYCFPWSFFITNNCSVRKDTIIEAGMFDEGYEGWGCEDLDLGYRLYKNGCIFIKQDIKSVHQEHPIKPGDDGIKNIYRFTEKYDSAEILLFYFSNYILEDKERINNIVKDIHAIEKKAEAFILISLFTDILKIVRDREMKVISDNQKRLHKMKSTKEFVLRNKQNISNACTAIEEIYECKNFTAVLNELIIKILKINIYDDKYNSKTYETYQ